MWSTRFAPGRASDLAVHPKKLDIVRRWFERIESTNALCSSNGGGHLLVLSGPVGAGKSAAAIAMANDFGLRVRRTANDAVGSEDSLERIAYGYSHTQRSKSDMHTLRSVLLQSSRYKSLFPSSTGTSSVSSANEIVLIDPMPLLADDDEAKEFNQILDNYIRPNTNAKPSYAVIIVTESADSGRQERWGTSRFVRTGWSVRRVLSQALLRSPRVTHVEINPVAKRAMKKALQRVATMSGASERATEKDLRNAIDDIVDSVSGDVRHGVQCLEWYVQTSSKTYESINSLRAFLANGSSSGCKGASLKRMSKRKTGRGRGDARTSKRTKRIHMFGESKRERLAPFHAIARLLYAKREPRTEASDLQARSPLTFVPETVARQSGMDGSRCAEFVHRNCPAFFEDVKHLSNTIEHLSDLDIIDTAGRRYPTRRDDHFPSSYVQSIASRAVANENLRPTAGRFRQITGSLIGGVRTAVRQNRMLGRYWLSRYLRHSRDYNDVATLYNAQTSSFVDVLPSLAHLCTRDSRRLTSFGFREGDLRGMNAVRSYSKPYEMREVGKRNHTDGTLSGTWTAASVLSNHTARRPSSVERANNKGVAGDDDDPIEDF